MSPKITTAHEQHQRDRILQGAANCFRLRGYHETSVQDICDAAGLSKGGLYTYFKSKDEILAAIVEHNFLGVLEQAHTAVADVTSAVDKLERVATLVIDQLMSGKADGVQSPQLMSEIWAEASKDKALKALCAQGYERWRTFLAGMLREGMAQGQVRADVDADVIAAILVAVFDGLTLLEAVTQRKVDWGKMTATLRLALGEGLLKQGTQVGGIR